MIDRSKPLIIGGINVNDLSEVRNNIMTHFAEVHTALETVDDNTSWEEINRIGHLMVDAQRSVFDFWNSVVSLRGDNHD